ncbi:hypothetical protein AB0K48_44730, partial [Nonomuraea sp. NPDC055795]
VSGSPSLDAVTTGLDSRKRTRFEGRSGFLYGRLRGHDLETAVRLGSLTGAHACTVAGTHESPLTETALLARA